ncbi:MAG: polyhydroxyalkanoate synthesis repressor PhaR [Acidiferrobacterales bacterium]|nr:polyhydroxyalkanoate synthesis repressor PhaR [Acidiferrobacterales bacterium]
MAEPRIIKKYPNRRLYDTELSRYITLSDVRDLVLKGVDFRVVAANSDEDLTRSILLQIIIEQESGGEPLFTTEVLSKMIRFYGDSVQGAFTNYLEKSLVLFMEQQKLMQDQMRNVFTGNPLDAMTQLTQRNLEIWKEIQQSFLKAAGVSSTKSRHDKPDEP